MLGLPLSESLAPLATPSPSLPLAPLLSRDSGISSPNLRVRQDLLDQAKQESEGEEDRSTEPRSEEEGAGHGLSGGDDMEDENIADDLGDIENESLSLEDNEDPFKDARVHIYNIEGAEEEPSAKKIKREEGRLEDFNLDKSSDEGDGEPDLPFYKFSCELCEIALQSKETLFMHMLNDHFSVRLREGNKNSLKSGACYECYTEFSDQDQLITHLAKKHGKLNKLLEEYGLQRIDMAEEDEMSGLEEEENANLNGSEKVKKEKKYGCTQDLINDIDQLISGAAQNEVGTGEVSSAGSSRDHQAKSKVEKESGKKLKKL